MPEDSGMDTETRFRAHETHKTAATIRWGQGVLKSW